MNRISKKLYSYGKFMGILLSITSLIFFSFYLIENKSYFSLNYIYSNYKIIILSLFIYFITIFIMIISCKIISDKFSYRIKFTHWSIIFMISQIGKYIPGNVAHFFGRAYLAKKYGMPLEASGIAIVLEQSGVLIAGAILAGLAATLGFVEGASLRLPIVVGMAAIVALAVSILLVRKRLNIVSRLTGTLICALTCYLTVFVLLSAANIVLISAMSGDWSWPSALRVASALVVSWLIGFVTPGAPAGLGLREISFFSLLSGAYPDSVILFAAAGFRLVTIVGDALAWLIGVSLSSLQGQP
ncbi:lysylphosphatidylglycerol synthase domain-containing protein [Croceicoccus estronivorus]|uniref:lysylphosphatidylglycerol synthase domain-containing protein n=1 Tax=Croceicoccus estronivorus TaxID=1172626 RepID=UPI0009EDA1DE|nr:lysylphosphatidylglycerol synthase domain-containing protein [Croceicoccus estronivorus]